MLSMTVDVWLHKHTRPSTYMWQSFITIFLTIFLAEIGDKTQLATILFSAKGETSRWLVLAASACALVLASVIGVAVGGQLERFVSPTTLKVIAGLGFIGVGLWTLIFK